MKSGYSCPPKKDTGKKTMQDIFKKSPADPARLAKKLGPIPKPKK